METDVKVFNDTLSSLPILAIKCSCLNDTKHNHAKPEIFSYITRTGNMGSFYDSNIEWGAHTGNSREQFE